MFVAVDLHSNKQPLSCVLWEATGVVIARICRAVL